MTLRVIDGFDYFGSSTAATALLGALGWSGNGLGAMRFLDTTAFGYGRSFQWTLGGNTIAVNKFLRGQWTTAYVFGMRMLVPTNAFPESPLNQVYSLFGRDTTSSRDVQWQISFDSYGTITFFTITNGVRAVYAKTLPWAFVPGNWFYLEVDITPGYLGTLEVRINTVPVLSLINVRMSDGVPVLPATSLGITHLGWDFSPINNTFGNPSPLWGSDDFYFLTKDGTENNDFLGNVRAKYMPVRANSTPLDWDIGGTSPAPTNWQSVLNVGVDDTTYVYADTIGTEDFYEVDPNLNTPTVYGVEISGAYKQDDATQRSVANNLRSGATTSRGDEFFTNASYTFAYDIYELNPDTGLGWSGAEVNAIQVGPKVVS